METDAAVLVAAALFLSTGLGFGLPSIYGMKSLAAGDGVATFMGFPCYGSGPFERHGIPSTVPLLATFLAVCLLEVAAAILLWQGSVAGAWLGLALLVPGAVFWWGFALPIPPVVAALRTGLLAWRWGTLSATL